MDFADRVTRQPSVRALPRMLRSLWGQARANPVCPPTRIDGRLALVTGGSLGIGLETIRGLAARGAEVIAAARHRAAGEQMVRALEAEHARPAHFLPHDLADLSLLPATLDGLESVLRGRTLDLLIANAGYWPTRYGRSPQGHELAFATNVLGHAALIGGARQRGLLADGCRIVIVTGDLYVTERRCSPDFRYEGKLGGFRAYARSKLGNLWYARELARRDASLRVLAVHPGTVATGLGGRAPGLVDRIRRTFLLSPEQGAQTTLFCATQPSLESGAYYHNVLGRMELRPDDPAMDATRSAALWELVESLRRPAPSARVEPAATRGFLSPPPSA